MAKCNFIRTTDKDTGELLISLGFQLVDKNNGVYTFLNSDKMEFSNDVNKSKIQYSNMLTF